MKDTTCFDTQASLVRALLKAVPNFKKDHPGSEFYNVIFIERNEKECEVKMDKTLDLSFKKGLLIKTGTGAYNRFVSKQGLVEDDWQFEAYSVIPNNHQEKEADID